MGTIRHTGTITAGVTAARITGTAGTGPHTTRGHGAGPIPGGTGVTTPDIIPDTIPVIIRLTVPVTVPAGAQHGVLHRRGHTARIPRQAAVPAAVPVQRQHGAETTAARATWAVLQGQDLRQAVQLRRVRRHVPATSPATRAAQAHRVLPAADTILTIISSQITARAADRRRAATARHRRAAGRQVAEAAQVSEAEAVAHIREAAAATAPAAEHRAAVADT